MDTKSIGNTIAGLRKKYGMTQLALAERLNVSDKVIVHSKRCRFCLMWKAENLLKLLH